MTRQIGRGLVGSKTEKLSRRGVAHGEEDLVGDPRGWPSEDGRSAATVRLVGLGGIIDNHVESLLERPNERSLKG